MDPATIAAGLALVKELVPMVIKELSKTGRLQAAISDAELTVALDRALDERARREAAKNVNGGAGNGTL
jgi:DNA-binding TFAR19-related protein (PDSD5 family)